VLEREQRAERRLAAATLERAATVREPEVGLRERAADRYDEQRWQHRDEEAGAPADARLQEAADCGGQRDPDRRARLHEGRVPRALSGREALAHVGLPGRPLAADAEAREHAEHEQAADALCEAASERARAVGEDRPLQDAPAAVAVGHEAEEHAAGGGRGERRAEHERELEARERQLLSDRDQEEGVEDEVVEIEDPARPREEQDPVVDGRRALVLAEELGRHGGIRASREASAKRRTPCCVRPRLTAPHAPPPRARSRASGAPRGRSPARCRARAGLRRSGSRARRHRAPP